MPTFWKRLTRFAEGADLRQENRSTARKLRDAMGIRNPGGRSVGPRGTANVTLRSLSPSLGHQAGQCEVVLVSHADNPRSGAADFFGHNPAAQRPSRVVSALWRGTP